MPNREAIERVAADLAKARRRLAELHAGQHAHEGPAPAINDGRSFASVHFANQLTNQTRLVGQLEELYVNTMIGDHVWSPASIIHAMEGRKET